MLVLDRYTIEYSVALGLQLIAYSSFIWGTYFFFRMKEKLNSLILANFTLFLTIMCLNLYYFANLPKVINPSIRVGVSLTLFSVVLFWWAIRHARRVYLGVAFNQSYPSQDLLSTGPYAMVRHPFYCSYMLAWIGGALMSQSWVPAVPIVLIYLLYRKAVKQEEETLKALFGTRYEAYQQKTGLLFPCLRRSKNSSV